MKTEKFNRVTVTYPEWMDKKEVEEYIKYIENDHPNRKLDTLDITVEDHDEEMVNMHYKFLPEGFERIRRITGYLVGTMDNWNSAKTAEEKDRVKHSVAEEI